MLAGLSMSQREDIQFEHLSMRDGLSMNPVMAITQDAKGFMWFGTQDGLNRYDGYSFKVYKNKEGDSKAIRDGMDIAFCVYNRPNKQLYYAGANRPLVIVGEDGLREIKATPQPVGFSDSPKKFENHSVQLKEGDMVYVFSDGFIDQFGGPHGKKFKYSRFKELLESVSKLPVKEQHQKIQETFLHWKGELEQLDDICVLGVRI